MIDPASPTAKAMLCHHAEVANGVLYISGGGLTRVPTRPESPHPVHLAVAMIVRIPWSATDASHRMVIELISDRSGDPGENSATSERVPINLRPQTWLPEDERGVIIVDLNAGRSDDMVPGEEVSMPFALPLYGRPMPRLGTYFLSVVIDDDEVDRLSFRLVSMAPVSQD